MQTQKNRLYSLSYLTKNITSDEEIIRDLIQIFLDNTPEDLRQLIVHSKNGEIEKMVAAGHKMKSSIDTLGIDQLYHPIRRVDRMENYEKHKDSLHETINEINEVMEEVFKQMREDFSL